MQNHELTEEAKCYINKIFERMIVICPAWKSSATGNTSDWAKMYKSELTAALKEAGVKKGEQINAGLARMREDGNPFLPAPGHFAKHCLGVTDKGLTHNTAAYTNRDYDTYGQRQICHKRSEEMTNKGLLRIKELRKVL